MSDAGHKRPWALLVTRNFPPLVGGMEKLNQYLLESLAPEWRLALSGPEGSREFAPRDAVVRESRIRPLAWFLAASTFNSVRLALSLRPTLVLAGSGLSAPIAWLAGRLTGARIAVYLHGLDIIAPSRLYQAIWLPFIRRFDVIIVNSQNTARLAVARGIDGGRIAVLHPGTNLPVLDSEAGTAFRARQDLPTQAILLSVGRLTRRKGLAEFVASALPGIVSNRPDAMLIVIGDEASDALHGASGGERMRILETAREFGVEQHVRFLGRCDEAELVAAYQAADCHVFPVLDVPGDVEGFGMVALESAAHGLPTVAFDVGGVADAVAPGRSGELVASGDYQRFGANVIAMLEQPRSSASAADCRQFASHKSWPRFAERLRDLVRPPHA
jgi:phosphatidylinositol alpha-1,6-mannosyltransferase